MSIEVIESIIIPIIGAIITIVALPFLREVTTEKQREKARFWVEAAVMVAEKRFGPKAGKRKKEFVHSFLSKRGVKMDIEELDSLIDAMVEELLNVGGKEEDEEE